MIPINRQSKWIRSKDGPIAGVFSGLGKTFNIDPNVLRVLWILSIVFFGTGLLIYPLLAFVLPREDELKDYHQRKLLGVCYKLSRKFGVELPVVRLLAVVSLFCSLGLTLLFYIGLAFFLPEEEKLYF